MKDLMSYIYISIIAVINQGERWPYKEINKDI